jgi:Sulfotransferase family
MSDEGARAADAESVPAEYLFVVGLSRSGTTLMRRLLNAAPEVAIGPESHFMGHLLPGFGVRDRLAKVGRDGDAATDAERITQLIYDRMPNESGARRPSRLWTWLVRAVPREELAGRLRAAGTDDRSVFATVMDLYAERKGARVRGEKTPAHLRHVPTLLRWFPSGRVLHMVRDPRAVFVSELRRQRSSSDGPYPMIRLVPGLLEVTLLTQTVLTWVEAAARVSRYATRYPGRYRMVRFEDLVREPEPILRGVCDFVGIPYEPEMIARQKVVSQGARLGEAGIDADAADRWRATIPGWADLVLSSFLGPSLRAFGYPSRGR